MRALSGVSRVAIIDHHRPCFMLTTISTKQYNFYHWSLLLGNDYIDHHQVRALARAAGPSHVLGSRGKVRSLFFFRILKLEQLDDLLFSCQCCHLTIPITIEIIANCCTIDPLTSTKGLSLPLLHSSQDYQLKAAKRRPQMIPRWGKSFATYPYTYRPIDPYKKRLWECNSSSQVWSGRGGIHPVFTNIEQHRAKVPFFAYSNEHLIIDFNINNICIQAAILIYIANQGRRVRRLRRLHVRRRLLTQLGSRQRHPWHSRPGEGSSPSS